MAEVSGTIGTKRDLRVRLGTTLRPQVLTLRLASGQVIDPADTELVASIFLREADTTPLSTPTFDVEELAPTETGEPRYRITLSKEKISELVALPMPATPGGPRATTSPGVRNFYWTCAFEDSGGARLSLYYGKLAIYLGAAGG
jgi:hypothetical protein